MTIDHEVNPSGVAIWGAILGQRCDSTRAKIIAATAMLAAPSPCHIGVDNLNTVRFANKIIQDIDYKTKRPYGLIPNGDVLEIFLKHLKSKSTTSVSVSKVKGHATPEDVVEGRTTTLNRTGNDMSDNHATKGIQAHSPSAIHYSKKCGGREKIRIHLQHDLNLFCWTCSKQTDKW